MNKLFLKTALIAILSTTVIIPAYSQRKAMPKTSGVNIAPLLDANNVSWDTPGPTSQEAMPIGNGDIGLNVWVEKNGDLVFYIGKTDSWGADVRGAKGLMKVGKVRVSLSPNQLTEGTPFVQTLKLRQGEILVKEGTDANGVQLRVWVDANNPVIRVETNSKTPVAVKVALEDWRLGEGGDTVYTGKPNTVAWYHRNSAKANVNTANLTYGAIIKGQGLVSKDNMTLASSPTTSQLISIYPLTAQTPTIAEWKSKLDQSIAKTDQISLEQSRVAHQKWWNDFWHRSWVFFTGDESAKKINQGYILQRFITACAGRGNYPIKFNGSIFIVDRPAVVEVGNKEPKSVDADFRTWGGQYWFQNTRAMYWPMLKKGDFEMLMPLFKMYAKIAADNEKQVEGYYHHKGSYFAETAPHFGGLRYWGPEVKEDWTGHYFSPILELSMMMLDYYEFTGDKKFAKEILIPTASLGLEFYDKHFKRDAQGKLLLDPVNSIEQFWKVYNPAPDIAGLEVISTRMLALPKDMTDASSRADWTRLRSELPELPKGTSNNLPVLLPYGGEQNAKPRNNENPELYAVFPYRIYGLGKPDLQLAVNSFNERKKHTQKGCWVQDPIQAAQLGLTDVAKTYVSFNFLRKDPQLKFPAFWLGANDYAPDQDNGGCAEHAMQEMLMQTEGKKIILLNAWPKEWDNVEFKLHAPYNTTVQGKIVGGKLANLVVSPASRKADVIDMSLSK
jgi:alpha-L-fucosidase 2